MNLIAPKHAIVVTVLVSATLSGCASTGRVTSNEERLSQLEKKLDCVRIRVDSSVVQILPGSIGDCNL